MRQGRKILSQGFLLLTLGVVVFGGCVNRRSSPLPPAPPIPPVLPTPIPCLSPLPVAEGPAQRGSYFGPELHVFRSLAEVAGWGHNWENESQIQAVDFASEMLIVYSHVYSSGCYPLGSGFLGIRLGEACFTANQINLMVYLVYSSQFAPNPPTGPPEYPPPPACGPPPLGPCYPCDPVIEFMDVAGTLPDSSLPVVLNIGYIYE